MDFISMDLIGEFHPQAPKEINMPLQLFVCYQAGPGAYQYQTRLLQL